MSSSVVISCWEIYYGSEYTVFSFLSRLLTSILRLFYLVLFLLKFNEHRLLIGWYLVELHIKLLQLIDKLVRSRIFLELNELEYDSLISVLWCYLLELFASVELILTIPNDHQIEDTVALDEPIHVPHLLECLLFPLAGVQWESLTEFRLGWDHGNESLN